MSAHRTMVVLIVLLTAPAFGQTAGMLSFQGLIKDGGGIPVNGSVDLEFRIFDAETLGNLVDMDGDGIVEDVIGEDAKQTLGVTATNGILSAKFGPVSPKSFDGNPRWLEVSVDGSPLPRIEIVTAPATAEQVNTPASGQGVIHTSATGNVGIGMDAGGDRLTVAGAIRSESLTIPSLVDTRVWAFGTADNAGVVGTFGPNGNSNVNLTVSASDSNVGWIAAFDSAGAERASIWAGSGGEGFMRTRGPNGSTNVHIDFDGLEPNRGKIAIADANSNDRINMWVNDSPPSGAGIISTSGPNGNSNVSLTVNAADGNLGWMGVFNAGGEARASMFISSPDNAGGVWVGGPNGSVNAQLMGNGSDPNLGRMIVANATGNTKVDMFASTTESGKVLTYGSNGSLNAGLTVYTSNVDHGRVFTANANGDERAVMWVGSTTGAGQVRLTGPNGNNNVRLAALSTNADHGRVSVYDSAGVAQAGIYVDAAGNGIVWGDTKSFMMPHPKQPGKEIWYACPEGPEAAAYFRGTARLVNGAAEIPCPNHFQNVAVAHGMTVNLTPLSADSQGLAVVKKSIDSISIRELSNGRGNYEFDYYVMAVRRGHEGFKVVRVAPSAEAVQFEGGSPALEEDAPLDSEVHDQILERRATGVEAHAPVVPDEHDAGVTLTPRSLDMRNAVGAAANTHARRAVRQHVGPDASKTTSERRND